MNLLSPSVALNIVVYCESKQYHVVGPPIQHLSSTIEMRLPQGDFHSAYRISGSFFPAMPHALTGDSGLQQWIDSLTAQGLAVESINDA